jgi:hypothetical protein
VILSQGSGQREAPSWVNSCSADPCGSHRDSHMGSASPVLPPTSHLLLLCHLPKLQPDTCVHMPSTAAAWPAPALPYHTRHCSGHWSKLCPSMCSCLDPSSCRHKSQSWSSWVHLSHPFCTYRILSCLLSGLTTDDDNTARARLPLFTLPLVEVRMSPLTEEERWCGGTLSRACLRVVWLTVASGKVNPGFTAVKAKAFPRGPGGS